MDICVLHIINRSDLSKLGDMIMLFIWIYTKQNVKRWGKTCYGAL